MKPGNVMLTRQGHVKLIDFGIARFFRPTHETDTQLLGTPGYAPPEQYGTTQTDERSDVYALGMTLYHLLTDKFSETGFGAKARDIRATNPQVSVAVACALEKATALEPSDRYESIAAFRRALLGAGAFVFETGEAASEPHMLAELCARYPEEAFEYLASGEIANWLQDIGEDGLSAIAWHIRAAQLDPQQAVEQFLYAVLEPNDQFSSSSSSYMSNENGQYAVQRGDEHQRGNDNSYHSGYQHYVPNQAALSSYAPRYATAVAVKPKTLDFGPVYPPGISAPLRITIDGSQNLWVKGTIRASQSWIRLDRTEFDGTNTHVNVQIRSSQLSSYTTCRGEIIISPEGGTPVTVVVGADIQGYTSQARRPGKTISPEDDDEDDEEELARTAQSQQHATPEPISIVALDQKALTKYGPPNETAGGWDASMMSPRQQVRSRYGLTFATACMAGAFWYILLVYIFTIVMLTDVRFVLFLAGIVPATTLGTMLVARPDSKHDREVLNRLITGVSGALLVLGPANALLQTIASAANSHISTLGLLLLLALTALGATYGTDRMISKTVWSRMLMASKQTKYIHWFIVFVAVISGGALGYLMTVGVMSVICTVFGVLVGIGIATAFIGRLNHLLALSRRP